MPSYLVTGVSRGMGVEFLRQLSENPENTVIGIARNKADTEVKVAEWKRSNVHILQADLVDYDSLKQAAEDTARITGGQLDCVIANGALISAWSSYGLIGELGQDPKRLEEDLLASFHTNVVGNIHLFNLLMPLILKGDQKKVIAISSGMAEPTLMNKWEIAVAAPYAISKAALNFAMIKFNAQYAKEGVLCMAICPGSVQTDGSRVSNLNEAQMGRLQQMFGKFQEYAPDFKGPVPPEDAVRDVLSVVENASLSKGDGGAFVSHFGNQQWL